MKKNRLWNVAAILVGLLLVSSFAQAQGTMFVTGNKVGIGTASPSELLHLLLTPAGAELKMRLEQDTDNAWAYSITDSGARGNEFRISKQGSGGPEVSVINQGDPGGLPTMKVYGSIEATNLVFASAREKKTDFEPVNPSAVLARVNDLEMSSWRYKEGSPGRHIGPIAEDFADVFELGSSSKTISVVDANGIALAAIQGLYAEVQKRDRAIEDLAAQLAEMQGQLDSISNH